MKVLFSAAVQSGIISLFSSTSSNQLQLFSTHCDESLPSDAFIGLLNDRSSEPHPHGTFTLVSPHSGQSGFLLDQTVLHIQSPTLTKTYIRCPAQFDLELGLKPPWIYLQVRNLCREWSFEVGIVDHVGRKGILRFSTFQKRPRLKIPANSNRLPLLHLPLSFPTNSTQLTAWSTISLHLPTFLPHFTNTNLTEHESEPIDENLSHAQVLSPAGQYSHISYVKIYSTCRLRRIWFSDGGPSQKLPWEFELYARE
ncbi:hypothetical protein J3R30DRAFT_3419259 [Lentinula aciculospora]|uniref:CFA20 domain-containing protein n=1 Tax=Lentinula aciculospora TaxID=153920 RepID=A0A9W9ATD8_9AGAR|nr:hypothetical protein J3R30DRAFT_3419259 [Lentinula aciculospora]